MASSGKTRSTRTSKARMAHNGDSKDHGSVEVRVTIEIGPLQRIPKGKRRRVRKAAPKQAKAFLKWALTQL